MAEENEFKIKGKEVKQWVFGCDVEMQMKMFLESEQTDFDRDFLIKELVNSYENCFNK